MFLEFLEKLIRRFSRLCEIGDDATDADRDGFLVRIEEAHAGHAFRHGPGRLDHHALVALDIEALFDDLGRDEVHFLHGERDLIRLGRLAQAGARPEKTIDAFGQNDDIGHDRAAGAVRAHADHLAVRILHEFERRRLGQEDRTLFLGLLREPAVELRAYDRVAIGLLFVEFLGTILHARMRALGHEPETLLHDMALKRRVLAEIRNDLLEHVCVEDRALDVLGAGIFAALQLQDVEAARGEGEGGCIAGHACPDDDGVESLDHVASPVSRRAGPWNAATAACGKLRSKRAGTAPRRSRCPDARSRRSAHSCRC